MKRFLLALALILAPIVALAADANVPSSAVISASSGNVAAGTATATLAAQQGMLNRLCGFVITSSGSTAAAVVSPTVTGVKGGTMTYTYTTVAGATLANNPLIVTFAPCVPATAPNVAIVVSMPSLGAGSTNAAVVANGFQTQNP
jgi:hypothetical protein